MARDEIEITDDSEERDKQAAEQQRCSRNGIRGEWEGPFQGMAVLASWYGFLNTQETQLGGPANARW